jgi:TolB-like protein
MLKHSKINITKKIFRPANIVVFFILLSIPSIGFSENNFNNKINELVDNLIATKTGSVLFIDKDTVYIDKGQQDDIAPGNIFDVIRPGDPLMENGTVIGFKETNIGNVTVERVKEKLSICRVTKKTADIKKGDTVFRQSHQMTNVAVNEFISEQGHDLFAQKVSQRLIDCFINKGINVVNEKSIDTPSEKVIGVDGVITGKVVSMGNLVIISARMLNANQSKIISAARVEIEKDGHVAALFNTPDGSTENSHMPAKENQKDATGQTTFTFSFGKPHREGNYFESYNACVTVTSVEKSQSNINMDLVYENLSSQNLAIKIKTLQSVYLVDENNQRWDLKTDTAGLYKKKKIMRLSGKLNTRLMFTPAGNTNGTVFSLHMEHTKPSTLNVVIHDIRL